MRAMPRLQHHHTDAAGRAGATYHSIQLSFNRRFRNGVSFGFNDTIGLSRPAAARRASSTRRRIVLHRDDQAEADELLGPPKPQTHIMKANFVWDLPDLSSGGAAARARSRRQ